MDPSDDSGGDIFSQVKQGSMGVALASSLLKYSGEPLKVAGAAPLRLRG